MRIAIFGGSFDPVHIEHVRFVRAAIKFLNLDKVIVIPSYKAPHKANGARAGGEDRLNMCRIAFRAFKNVEVSDFELQAGGTSYSYLTCRAFAQKYPHDERFFLMGADMFEGFASWREPDDILSNVRLAVCGRGKGLPEETKQSFSERFGVKFEEIPFTGAKISSTDLRVALAFGYRPRGLDGKVLAYLRKNGLYRDAAVPRALRLEKPSRRKHSFRVALMACGRARSVGVPEDKALLAAALHDCGKYVPLSSGLLDGFDPPSDVPPAVMHQFTGAYLAEHIFGVDDGEVLDAIRYHTSGRADMTRLDALIYLSDLLESERDFAGIAKLREMFYRDLDACLLCSLALQIDHLRNSGGEICKLTQEAYDWERHKQLTIL